MTYLLIMVRQWPFDGCSR